MMITLRSLRLQPELRQPKTGSFDIHRKRPVTKGEVIGLFQDKYERSITDFMEQKSIPPFDLTVKYVEHTGTVASIEDNQVFVSTWICRECRN